ncbi:MAG: ribonuclease [Bacteroidales bacterium]|nr:MAG: ribonuclease [Bacteroidales bacterium]
MEAIKITILGSGSALPRKNHFHASQVLEVRGNRYMIDCGEGAQIKIGQYGVSLAKLNNIFISHLHSDHCIGLVGLISTMAMLGRKESLTIHAHKDLKRIMSPMLDYFIDEDAFPVIFNDIDPAKHKVIYSDKRVMVSTIPLKHRVPTCGFLFEEPQGERHLIKAMIDAFEIPIRDLKGIKKGADFVDKEGFVVKNNRLTTPPTPPRKYAYLSDTLYNEAILPYIQDADCIYHEATFLETERERAIKTMHSTAIDAATIAQKAGVRQLIIGHYSARYRGQDEFLSEAKTIFQNTVLAKDGLRVEF